MKPEIERHASRPINSPSTSYASTSTTMNNNNNNHNNALFGKYEFGRLLGCGAFAKVYLARNVETGQNVAVKIINKKKIAGTSLASNIKREISIMRRLRHPYIVRLFEVMATRGKIYFVMELVKGGELFSRVAKSRFSEDLSRKYFQQLISAIGYCHSRGVYHRDLKPENLLVDENGDLKVSDFGLSAVKDRQRQQQTLLQTLCGTPAYVAPEILTKKGYDGSKVDVWSSGIILFVLNAGYLPFNDPNLMNMYRKIYKGEFRCPKWFSPDLKRFLTRLLDTNPATRMTIDEITRDPWFVKGPINYYNNLQNQTISKYLHDCDDDEEDYDCDDNLNEDDISSSSSTSTSTSTSSTSSSSIAPTNKYRNRHTFSNEVNDHQSLLKEEENGMRRCSSLNAFDLISFSSGLDLSGLFDKESNTLDADRFFSAESPDTIMDKIQSVVEGLEAEEIKLKMMRRRRKKKEPELLASLDLEDPNGNLVVNVEIRLLTDVLVVVELKRGEAIDYNDIWKNKIRPHLDDLVYQGSESYNIT